MVDHLHMLLQITLLSKGVVAEGAQKRFLFSVGPDVVEELALVDHRQPAWTLACFKQAFVNAKALHVLIFFAKTIKLEIEFTRYEFLLALYRLHEVAACLLELQP